MGTSHCESPSSSVSLGSSEKMVERWEGIVRAWCSGFKGPTRVMASLLICAHTGTLKKPTSNAVLFMGDCVRGSGNPTVDRLSRLETMAHILVSKLGDPLVNAWVVEASSFNGPFACYEAFLPSMSPYGEPLCYDPHNLPASRAIISLLHNCLVEVNKELVHPGINDCESSGDERKENQEEHGEETIGRIPKTLLFGFSKGGVVLNQFLSEIAFVEKHSMNVVENLHSSAQGVEIVQKQKAQSTTSYHADKIWPATICELLKSIVAIHYIDVGLNCPGAYQTDASVLENVVKAAASSSSGLHLGFHGTPRQWNDKNRPWIASEKDHCIKTLQMIAKRLDSGKIQITEKLYFEQRRPSLQMHFEILECLKLD